MNQNRAVGSLAVEKHLWGPASDSLSNAAWLTTSSAELSLVVTLASESQLFRSDLPFDCFCLCTLPLSTEGAVSPLDACFRAGFLSLLPDGSRLPHLALTILPREVVFALASERLLLPGEAGLLDVSSSLPFASTRPFKSSGESEDARSISTSSSYWAMGGERIIVVVVVWLQDLHRVWRAMWCTSRDDRSLP